MKYFHLVALALITSATLSTALSAADAGAGAGREAADHPRIDAAAGNTQGAIDRLKKAPDDFGGHKAAAIADLRDARRQERDALAYRARQDGK